MKIRALFLTILGFLFAASALANTAVLTSVNGTVQAQVGTAPARALRVGDEVQQGATISTGANSSAVLRFSDGQIAALTANSQMTITAYQYNAQAGTGNVLLSLVTGGMRAITGLIGKRTPDRVSYRAASATIGIRGTDVTVATAAGNVVVTVTEGSISFSFAGQTITIPAGQGVNAKTDGTFQRGAAAQIAAQAPPAVIAALNQVTTLTAVIQQAAQTPPPTSPPPGPPPPSEPPPPPPPTPSPSGPTGGTGGGSASTK